MAKKRIVEYKFWFSQNQANQSVKNNPEGKNTFAKLKKGGIVQYTQATFPDSTSHSSNWDDIKLLGIGSFDHCEQR